MTTSHLLATFGLINLSKISLYTQCDTESVNFKSWKMSWFDNSEFFTLFYSMTVKTNENKPQTCRCRSDCRATKTSTWDSMWIWANPCFPFHFQLRWTAALAIYCNVAAYLRFVPNNINQHVPHHASPKKLLQHILRIMGLLSEIYSIISYKS